MTVEIKMPALKPDMKSGVLCEWKVNPGDTVKSGEILFEIETDKVVSQVEAAADLKVTEIIAEEGDDIEVGTVIAKAEISK